MVPFCCRIVIVSFDIYILIPRFINYQLNTLRSAGVFLSGNNDISVDVIIITAIIIIKVILIKDIILL